MDHESTARAASWLRREQPLVWRHVANREATAAHRSNPLALSREARRVVEAVRRDGVVTSSLDALFAESLGGGTAALPRDIEFLLALVDDRVAAAAVDATVAAGAPDHAWSKPFLAKPLGEAPSWPVRRPLAQFAMQPELLAIPDHFFGMQTELADLEVWHNRVTGAPPEASQLWHRDMPDDFYVFKMFVYLTDVDEGAGPFVYAPGTHRMGAKAKLDPPGTTPTWGPKRSTDGEFATAFPRDDWKICTGPAGSVVFAETRGYHKGGYCLDKDRLMLVVQFGSRVCRPRSLGRRYRRDEV